MIADSQTVAAAPIRPLVLVGAIMALTIVGDYFLKLASERAHPIPTLPCLIGTLLYASTALLWAQAMSLATLAALGVYYSVLTVISMALLGAIVFGEELRLREIIGMGLAILSIVLMGRFAE